MKFKILTQSPLVIDLSRPALLFVIGALNAADDPTWSPDVACEIGNFQNLLHNILERTEPDNLNLDLVGG